MTSGRNSSSDQSEDESGLATAENNRGMFTVWFFQFMPLRRANECKLLSAHEFQVSSAITRHIHEY